MAVTYVTEGHNKVASGASPRTITSIVNLPDTVGISIVGFAMDGVSVTTHTNVSGVTLGGQTVNKLTGANSGDGTAGAVWLGYIFNSTIGSTGLKNLVVTFTGANRTVVGGVVCLLGHDAGTPCGTPVANTASAASVSADVTDATANDYVVHAGCAGLQITSSTPGQIWIDGATSQGAGWGQMGKSAGTGSTISCSQNNGNDWCAITAIAVKAATVPSYSQVAFRVYNDDGTGLGYPP